MIKVVLADDHRIVREGLRMLIEAESDLKVVGEAEDGIDALHHVELLRPDVLVLDLTMPGLNGLEVTRQVSKRFPNTRVVILSMHTDESFVLEALKYGAAAYVLKISSTNDLIEAIYKVLEGATYLSPRLSQHAVAFYKQHSKETEVDLHETLTKREREILQSVAEGLNSAEIAVRFSLSSRTVEMHRANLMHKLNLRSQSDLVRYAIRRGIISLEE